MMTLRVEEFELPASCMAQDHEDKEIENEIWDSYVPYDCPSGCTVGDYIARSEVERVKE